MTYRRSIGERIRMPLAHLIDRLFPRSCWAQWCCWAMGYWREHHEDRRFPPLVDTCHRLGPGESCWCGKHRGSDVPGDDRPAPFEDAEAAR